MQTKAVGLIASLFVVDRLLKVLVISSPQITWGDLFLLHINPGIAFSLPLPSTILYPLLSVGFIIVVWLLIHEITSPAGRRLSLFLILAGALSNIIDRIWTGGVIDYFAILSLGFYFNLADGMIVGGVLLLICRHSGKIR